MFSILLWVLAAHFSFSGATEGFSGVAGKSFPGTADASFPNVADVRPFRNGPYRAVLERKDGNEIVFNFEVKDSAGKKILYIRNAGERLLVDEIRQQGDSVWIHLPFFESQLRAVLTKEGNLEGVWLKRGVDAYQSVKFKAVYGQNYRFIAGKPARIHDITGRWRAIFRSPDGKDTTLRVGEFRQQGSLVTGTFLDAGGDLRYLEGVMSGDSLRLSCFDGSHAFLFTAAVDVKDHVLSGGQYFSGPVSREVWEARKDASAKLPDEFSITKWKNDPPLNFTFRDINGKMVSLKDNRFKGKVVLIQIMGSWCPNCMDETRFLSGFYDKYHSKGVEIIGLAYERSTDFARSQTSLRSFQQRFQVKYPMLITGVAVGDPQRSEKTLPQLERIENFPTTIFVGRNGKIEKVHTGFSGPGTGQHYEEQKKEFYTTVNAMLGE
ncbi:MAG TPA: TlpA disulfide reductase family protein [Puia sp.]|jgi:thiol-disulfide isomerase/thioredoxin